MTRDYYVILGISRGADPGQIKQAYRKIAKQCHPDAAPAGDPHRFREVQEAYETLSDQNRRRRYDRATAPVPVPPAGDAAPEPLVPKRPGATWRRRFEREAEEVFDVLGGGALYRRGRHRPTRDRHFEILLSPDEARCGCRVPIRLTVLEPCPFCFVEARRVCPLCGGRGSIGGERCLTLGIPPGMVHGRRVAIGLDPVGLPGAWLHLTFRIDPES